MLSKRAKPYDEASVPPNKRLARNVQDLVGSNAMSARRIQEVINDAHAAGAAGFSCSQVKDPHIPGYAKRLRNSYLKRNQWPKAYWAQIRVLDKDNTIKKEWVAFSMPSELLHCLKKYGEEEVFYSTDNMDVKARQHLQFC